MTYQETIWKDKYVMVTGIISRSGKMHRYVRKLVGRGGFVIGESKNNMLLVEFSRRNKDRQRVGSLVRAIPAGCLTLYTEIKRAGATCAVND